MTTKQWAGLDVGFYRTSVCVTDDNGGILSEADLDTDPLAIAEALLAYPALHMIAMESGAGNHLIRALRNSGLPVVMFDAFKASRFLAIRRNKSDRNDARGLADLARLGGASVTTVLVRGDECRNIRFKLHLRKGIIKQRVSAENLLRTLLREHGKTVPKSAPIPEFRAVIADLLSDPELEQSSRKTAQALVPLVDYCESVRRYNVTLNNEVIRLANGHEVCRRLMTVPGIGPVCALSFFSTIEDPWRFKRIADVGAYLGLAPKVRETGGNAGRARISKAGDFLTRSNLYISAQVALSNGYRNSDLCDWGSRTSERIGKRRAKVALARKLAITMAAVWKSGGEFIPFAASSLGRRARNSVGRTERNSEAPTGTGLAALPKPLR